MVNDPVQAWQQWIHAISLDPGMDRSRLIEHLQLHVAAHMPNADAPQERWLQWMAGTYNLLGILSAMTGCHPGFELGVGRLFQKWRQHPFDHTPPPTGLVQVCRDIAEARKP